MPTPGPPSWASLSPHPPRLITTLKPATVGTSGAVSLWGTAAAAGGALFIGVLAALLSPLDGALPLQRLFWLPVVGLAGGVGRGAG